MAVSKAELDLIISLRDEASANLARFTSQMQAMTAPMAAAASAATATAAAFTGLGAAAAGVAGFGVKLNADAEQTQVAFETLLGSADKATAFLDDLRQFSAATPFEFPELATSSQKLLAFGFQAQQIIPIMTSIGDAVGALGGTAADVDRVVMAMGQMQAKGKASNEELLQMAELGIPVYKILGDAFGKTTGEIQDMVSRGLVPAGAAIDALTKGMEQTFGGAMADQSATFNGLLSTLKDNAGLALQAFSGPLFNQAKGALEALGAAVSSPAFQQFAAQLGQQLGSAIASLTAALQPATNAAIAFGQALAAGQNPLQALFAALDQLLPGLGAFAQEAYTYGAQIVGQLAAGMQSALSFIVGIMTQIGALLAEWLQPHSPPKVAPHIDAWGRDTSTVYFDAFAEGDTSGVAALAPLVQGIIDQVPEQAGLAQAGEEAAQTYLSAWSSADYGALNELSGTIESTLKALQGVGGISETDVIPRVLGSREAISDLITQLRTTGQVSEDALGKVVSAAGPAGQTVRDFVQSYGRLSQATQAVASAQRNLNRVTAEYDARLKPMNAELKKTMDQKQAIDDQIRLRDLQEQLNSGKLDGLEAQRAQLEIQQIQQEAAIRGVESEKDAAVDQAQSQLDAAQTAKDAAQAQLDTQKAAIDAYNQQNSLIGEQITLNERLAKQAESAAKKGGGGAKKAGGGGIPIPDVAMPGLGAITQPLADLGAQVDAAKQRFVAFKDEVGNGFMQVQAKVSPVVEGLRSGFATLQQILAPLVPVAAGIVAGFAAFGALSGVATLLGGIGAGFAAVTANGTGLLTILGTIAGLLGGPVTLAIVGVSAAIALFAAAWVGNWGDIQGVMASVVAAIGPVIANLQTQLGLFWTNLQPGFAALGAALQGLAPIFAMVATVVGGVLVAALAGLGGMLPGLGQAFSGLMQVIAGVINLISAQVMGMVDIVSSLLSGDWAGAWDAAVQMVTNMAGAIGQIIGGLLGTVTGLINSLVGGVVAQFGALATMVGEKATEMATGFINAVTALPGQAAAAMAPLAAAATTAMANFISAAQTEITKITNVVNTALAAAKAAIDTMGSSFKEAGLALLGNFVQGIKDAAGKAVQAAKDVAQQVRDILPGSEPKDSSSPLSNLGHSGQAMMENFAAGIPQGAKSAIVATRQAAQSMAGILSDAFSNDAEFLRAKAEATASFAELVPDAKALESVNSQIERAQQQLANPHLNPGRRAGTEARLNQLYAKREEMLRATTNAQNGLAEAQVRAQQIAEQDPALANDYYQMRISQIKEIADLEKAQAEAKTQYEKNALQAQITALAEAQAAELAAFEQHLADVAESAQQALEDMADEMSSTVADLVAEMRDSTASLYRDQASAIRDLQDLYPDNQDIADAAQAITDAQQAVADYNQERKDIEAEVARLQITAAQNDDPEKRADAAAQILELQQQLSDLRSSDGAEAAQQLADAQAAYDALIAQQAQLTQIAQQAQAQLAQAQAEAAKLDPAIADDYYQMRAEQIMELAKLQQEMIEAQSDAERAAIQQQIALIQQAQSIEQQAFQDQIKDQANAVADAQQQIQDLINQYGSSMSAETLAELQALQKQLSLGYQQPQTPIYATRGGSITQLAPVSPPVAPTAASRSGESGANIYITFEAGAMTISGGNVTEAQVRRIVESSVDKVATVAFQRNRTK